MAPPSDPAKPTPTQLGAGDLVQRWGHSTLQGNLAFERGEDVQARRYYSEALAVAEALMLAAARSPEARAALYAPALFGIACNNIIELARRQDDHLTAGIFQCKLAAGYLSVMESNDAPLSLRTRCLLHSRSASLALCRYFEERGMWDAAEAHTARANAAFFAVQRLESMVAPRAQVVIQPARSRPSQAAPGDEVVLVLPDDVPQLDAAAPFGGAPQLDAAGPFGGAPQLDAAGPFGGALPLQGSAPLVDTAALIDDAVSLVDDVLSPPELSSPELSSPELSPPAFPSPAFPTHEALSPAIAPLALEAPARHVAAAPPREDAAAPAGWLPRAASASASPPEFAIALQGLLPDEPTHAHEVLLSSAPPPLSHEALLSGESPARPPEAELSRDALVSPRPVISNEALRAQVQFPDDTPRPSLPAPAPLQPPKTARARALKWLSRAFSKRQGRSTLTSLGDIVRAK